MFESAFLAALNHLLAGSRWAQVRLSGYAGKSVCLVMPPLQFGFMISTAGSCEATKSELIPDVTIQLPADTPLRLLQGIEQVMADAHVSGNVELATELSFLFRNLHWDAEEDLSHLFGDIPAHRLAQGAKLFFDWHRQMAERLPANITEYLTQENPLLLSTPEFAPFRDDVARLHIELTHLEARCKTI